MLEIRVIISYSNKSNNFFCFSSYLLRHDTRCRDMPVVHNRLVHRFSTFHGFALLTA